MRVRPECGVPRYEVWYLLPDSPRWYYLAAKEDLTDATDAADRFDTANIIQDGASLPYYIYDRLTADVVFEHYPE